MIDIKKEIQENDVLVVLFGEDYQKNLLDMIKNTEATYKKICYITLNKPYNNLIEVLKKNSIDIEKFNFVDAITSTVIKPASIKNCRFVTAPNALTELNLAIGKECISHNSDLFIFDSLSSLLIYEKGPTLIRFVHSVINELRTYNIKIIFTLLKEDYVSTLMKDLNMFVDKIIEIGKE